LVRRAVTYLRNTVYALAKDHPLNSIEEFGLALVRHFLAAGPTVKRARVHIVEYPWNRIEVNGRPHEHSFVRGSGERSATVTGTATRSPTSTTFCSIWRPLAWTIIMRSTRPQPSPTG
jgi:urate oxidase